MPKIPQDYDMNKFIDSIANRYITGDMHYDINEVSKMIARRQLMQYSESYRKRVQQSADSLTQKSSEAVKKVDSLKTNADALKNADSLKKLLETLPTVIEYK
jgi:hypothetical protein